MMPLSFNILIEVDIFFLGLQTLFFCTILTYHIFIFCNFRSVFLFRFVAKSSLFSLEYFIFASRSIDICNRNFSGLSGRFWKNTSKALTLPDVRNLFLKNGVAFHQFRQPCTVCSLLWYILAYIIEFNDV